MDCIWLKVDVGITYVNWLLNCNNSRFKAQLPPVILEIKWWKPMISLTCSIRCRVYASHSHSCDLSFLPELLTIDVQPLLNGIDPHQRTLFQHESGGWLLLILHFSSSPRWSVIIKANYWREGGRHSCPNGHSAKWMTYLSVTLNSDSKEVVSFG